MIDLKSESDLSCLPIKEVEVMKKRIYWGFMVITLFALLFFILSPFFARDRSLLSMKIYDRYQRQSSVQKELGYDIHFPLEKMELYPMMIAYNDNGLSYDLGKEVSFTVEYSFADFKKGQGYSSILNPEDPLYNAYIGSYSILGFNEALGETELGKVSRYDMMNLALPALGLTGPEAAFDILESGGYKDVHYISGLSFSVYESTVVTNGAEHKKDDFKADDLLYGRGEDPTVSFPLRVMKGRVYHHYFEEIDLNLALFTLGKSEEALQRFEELIINHVRIEFNNEKD